MKDGFSDTLTQWDKAFHSFAIMMDKLEETIQEDKVLNTSFDNLNLHFPPSITLFVNKSPTSQITFKFSRFYSKMSKIICWILLILD